MAPPGAAALWRLAVAPMEPLASFALPDRGRKELYGRSAVEVDDATGGEATGGRFFMIQKKKTNSNRPGGAIATFDGSELPDRRRNASPTRTGILILPTNLYRTGLILVFFIDSQDC